MYGALPKGAANVNGVLSIKKTQMFHGGTYTCTGKNAFSDDMATVQLRVGGGKKGLYSKYFIHLAAFRMQVLTRYSSSRSITSFFEACEVTLRRTAALSVA